jgi:hypothetical protein
MKTTATDRDHGLTAEGFREVSKVIVFASWGS